MSRDRPLRGRVLAGGRAAALVLAVALAVVLVGSVAPVTDAPPEGLGEVDGVAHDDPLDITVEDGLDEGELDALVARSMARIEVIRGLPFERSVDVEVITREAYRQRTDRGLDESERTWENLRWEALFVVGGDRDATAVLDEAFAEGVQGFYNPADERVVIVSDGDGNGDARVDKGTLVHELVHALQHQQFGFEHDAETTDARQARDSVVEGEAELVPALYLDRCGVVWSCVHPGEPGEGTDVELGIQVQLLLPYVQGQAFVDAIRERGGWSAVDALHGQFPESSAQVIHPDRYPEERPVDVTVPDRSSDAWQRLDESDTASDRTTDTLGEGALYALLVHSDVVDVEETLGYEHAFSTGWAGDQFVPYERNGAFGYVWEIAWESERDAEQFALAYRDVLGAHGSVETADAVVVPDGPFEGAFRVSQDGETVRIVNAPVSDALAEIHAQP